MLIFNIKSRGYEGINSPSLTLHHKIYTLILIKEFLLSDKSMALTAVKLYNLKCCAS